MCYNIFIEMKKLRNNPLKKKKVFSRTYNVEEPVLKLILGLETLLEQQGLPFEYRKIGYEYLTKMETLAGLREKKYLDYDIINYTHHINIDFAKTVKKKDE